MKKILFTLSALAFLSSATFAKEYTLESPSKKLKIVLDDSNPTMTYALSAGDLPLVNASEISIFANKKAKVVSTEETAVDSTWNTVWGQFSEVKDIHNEMNLSLDVEGRKANLIVRLFDDGVAIRYELPNYSKKKEKAIFNIEYAIDQEDSLYCPAGENEPYGPILFSSLGGGSKNDAKAEATTEKSKGKKGKKGASAKSASSGISLRIPVVIEREKGMFLGLLEGDLLANEGFDLMGIKYDNKNKSLVSSNGVSEDFEEGNTLQTPWRLIYVGEQVGDMAINNIALNVATECQIEDPSWVKPRKSLWDWRILGHKAPDGFVYGINNASYFRMIDFAKKEGIDAILIDDLWYTKATTGHFTLSKNFTPEPVMKYAKENGVDVFLYYDRKKGQYGDDHVFEYFSDLGTIGIKYGFMGRKVGFSTFAIKESARNKLLINFHDGPVPFAGGERTYPNAITREFCHAMQDSRKAFTQKCFIKQALINSLQGPLDMNNGNFNIVEINRQGARDKGLKEGNTYFTTVANECARCLIINTGFLCMSDAPDAYEAKLDLYEFIKELPIGKWDESLMLCSKIPEYMSVARRHGDAWFIGSATVQAQTMDIKLDFLKEGKTYEATLYEDAPDTDSVKNPEAYQIRKIKVKKGDVIKAKMVENGGHAIWIR